MKKSPILASLVSTMVLFVSAQTVANAEMSADPGSIVSPMVQLKNEFLIAPNVVQQLWKLEGSGFKIGNKLGIKPLSQACLPSYGGGASRCVSQYLLVQVLSNGVSVVRVYAVGRVDNFAPAPEFKL